MLSAAQLGKHVLPDHLSGRTLPVAVPGTRVRRIPPPRTVETSR
jgi:hypothetical protein